MMPQRVSCVFDVPQHSRNDHDSEPDPEQYEEASEVSILASWIEVRHPGSVFDRRKHPLFLLCSDLLELTRWTWLMEEHPQVEEWNGHCSELIKTASIRD